MKFYRLTYKAKERISRKVGEDGERFETLFAGLPDDISDISNNNAKAFISSYSCSKMSITAFVREGNIDEYINVINSYIPSYISDEPSVDEITCIRFNDGLSSADRLNEFDSEDIREEAGIEHLFGSFEGCDLMTEEKFTGENNKKDERYSSSSLDEEIARIRASGKPEIEYNPVHYIIGGISSGSRGIMLSVLLNELVDNGRLDQSRYTVVSVKNYRENPISLALELEPYFKIGKGGTMVFDIRSDINSSDGKCNYVKDLTSWICQIAEKYENETLCIFLVPDNSEKTIDTVCSMMPEAAFVKITENALTIENAKKYLSSKARADGIRSCRSLYKEMGNGSSFFIDELDSVYTDWHKKYIINKNFPVYSSLIESCTKVTKRECDENKSNAYDELMSMVGLEEAKKVINGSVDYFKARKLFADSGFRDERPSMHMVFTGAPGTAKTTVARLFAEIMKDNGILTTGSFVEVGRADLVGMYVGWTAQTVKEKFKKAEGGVLFIDEAYSLVDDRNGSFGDEAINTIVQEMENNRDNVIVIFAGYSDKMEEFLNKNPGLRSRIAFHVPFDDYTSDELYEIAELMAKHSGLTLSEGVKDKLLPIMKAASAQEDFGNGRFVRNLMEKARMKQAGRLVHSDRKVMTRNEIATLLPDDFEMPVITSEKQNCRKAIGF